MGTTTAPSAFGSKTAAAALFIREGARLGPARAQKTEMDKELLKWGIEHSDPEKLKKGDVIDPKSLVYTTVALFIHFNLAC